MLKKIIRLFSGLCFILGTASSQTDNDSCFQFISPPTGSIISVPSCTLEVQHSCHQIRSVEFQAQYFIAGVDTPTVQSLGSITRRPYKKIWDISTIPNQYYSGVEFIAIATMSDGKKTAAKRDRIFFLHNPVKQESAEFPYDFSDVRNPQGTRLQLATSSSTVKIFASFYWNEKEVSVFLDVKDPFFYTNITRENLASMGLELLLNTSPSRNPYPDSSVLMYVVPLLGKPQQVKYSTTIDELGGLSLQSTSQPCEFEHYVTKEDNKGYSILFSIPLSQFSDALPESLTCNIIAKTLDDKSNVIRTSWIQTEHIFESYCPILWGTITFAPKPLTKNVLLLFSISFFAGLLLVLVYMLVSVFLNKPHKQVKIEHSETEKQLLERIKATFEEKVIQKDLTVEQLAKELKFTRSKLNFHLKKLTGMSSQNYLMFCRTEIAKERLRSSHWSEIAIAEASGFESVAVMEKYFLRFNRISPLKFRELQQVS